jgi:hypothetical protein
MIALLSSLSETWKSEQFFVVPTPLVVWAMAAFYAATILKTGKPYHAWIKLGLIHGAVVSAVCLIHGFAVIKFEPPMLLGMLIPLYTAAWYAVTACPVPSLGNRHPMRHPCAYITQHPCWFGIYWRLFAMMTRHPPNPSPATVADADTAQQLLIFQLSQRAVQRGAIGAKLLR